jgi:hypothetical protein
MANTIEVTITREFEEDVNPIEISVTVSVSPAEPMVMYHKDGSGDPGCPAEGEIVSAIYAGKEIELTDKEADEAIEKAIEELGDYENSLYDDRDKDKDY